MVSLKSNRIVQLLSQSAMKSFLPATPHGRNRPATGQTTQGDARGQSCLMGWGEHIPWHLSHAALHGSCAWRRWGEREKLLLIKLSSLLPGYSCHVLVFTAFLLPPNNCTHSIYSTTHKTRSLSLVYVTKPKISKRFPEANADLCSFLLVMWVSKWNCLPKELFFLLDFILWKKKLLQLQCFPLLFQYISREFFFFYLILEPHNSWKRCWKVRCS